jgi:hypothetical protein
LTKPVHLVFVGEAGGFAGAMLFDTTNDAVGDADVEGSARLLARM